MVLSPIFDTIISLVLLFFFFSVLVSCIQEGTVSIFKTRGKLLSFAIDEVLNDKFNKNFGYLLYQHPQIDMLKRKHNELPSYIEPATFSKALIDLIAAESSETVYRSTKEDAKENAAFANKTINASQSLDKVVQLKPELRSLLEHKAKRLSLSSPSNDPRDIELADRYWLGVESLQNSDLKKLLQSFLSNSEAKEDLSIQKDLQKQIEEWYKGYMERVTGWYKRKIRTNILFASFAVTLVLNLNFITLAKTIYASGPLREALATEANRTATNPNAIAELKTRFAEDSTLANIDIEAILGVKLPIGWDFDNFEDELIPKKKEIKKKESEQKESDKKESDKKESMKKDSVMIDSVKVDSTRIESEKKDSVMIDSEKKDSEKKDAAKEESYEIDIIQLLTNILGWLIFALALSRGAPFWFDVLKKFVNVRNTGLVPNNQSGS